MHPRTIALASAALVASASAQWLNYPTAGVPRSPDGKPNLSAAAPRTPEGKPDLNGLWEPDVGDRSASVFNPDAVFPPEWFNIGAQLKNGLPLQPWARDLRAARKQENSKDSPDGKCLPMGPLMDHSNRSPRKFVQIPGLLVILYEKSFVYRQIFTDGRPLPEDPQPSFEGYSTAKWEGDTLVVKTIGLREGSWADEEGTPLTEAATITERYRRLNFGKLEIEVTVDDPKTFTAPWTVLLRHHIKLDTDLLEYVCLENEKSTQHIEGR